MSDIFYRMALAVVPTIYFLLSRLLFASCRIERFGLEHRRRCQKKGVFIAVFWHFSTYLIIEEYRGLEMTAMVSPSRDGDLMARLLEKLDCKAVRGSRRKGGLGALKEMVRRMAEGRRAAIVADGSQGPPRVMQAGAILLASKTGAPIVPVTWAADRYFAFKSWDRSILPKPFARIAICYGEPLHVPAKLQTGDLEKYRLLCEERLNDLYDTAWGKFGRQEH